LTLFPKKVEGKALQQNEKMINTEAP